MLYSVIDIRMIIWIYIFTDKRERVRGRDCDRNSNNIAIQERAHYY